MILILALACWGGPLLLVEEWAAPSNLPFARVHGLVLVGKQWVVGGIDGLAIQEANSWRIVDERPVRDLVVVGADVWAQFGDGSVDKLDLAGGRLFYDVLNGSAKRPWTSSLAASGDHLIFGGMGGWIERDGKLQTERYPKELAGQVVTSAARVGKSQWIGTQRDGLWQVDGKRMKRYGLAVLPDLWVAALAVRGGRLVVGMADGGVFELSEGRFRKLDCPGNKVRKLGVFHGRLVVGELRGAWIEGAEGWQRLGDDECTAITSVAGRLAVGSPSGVKWWS